MTRPQLGCGAFGLAVTIAVAGAALVGGLDKPHLVDALVLVVAGLAMTAVVVWPLRWAVTNALRVLSSVPRSLEVTPDSPPPSRWVSARQSLVVSRLLVVLSVMWLLVGLGMVRSGSSPSTEEGMVGAMGVLNAIVALLLGGAASAIWMNARRTMRSEVLRVDASNRPSTGNPVEDTQEPKG